MYCPVCFNDTLKIASSGVVKLTFNGKSKATSQFYYNIKQDKTHELLDKLEAVVKDYFLYYSNFQNKDTIKTIEAFSHDFKCSNGCSLTVNNRMNVIDILFNKADLMKILEKMGERFDLSLDIKKL